MSGMVSKEDIKSLAELARLKVSAAEEETLQKDISNILEYVGQVSAVLANEHVEVPLNRNVMRTDTPRAADDPLKGKEEALRVAFPKREGNYNVVRTIIQKDE